MKRNKKPHYFFMDLALKEARKAQQNDEVPVGAVVVKDGRVIARGFNQTIQKHDPSGHAEIIALRRAAKRLKNERLNGTILYVTLEPCVMCAGALIQGRVKTVVYGANDPKAGACGSIFNLHRHPKLNHTFQVVNGVLADESRKLLQDFFRTKR